MREFRALEGELSQLNQGEMKSADNLTPDQVILSNQAEASAIGTIETCQISGVALLLLYDINPELTTPCCILWVLISCVAFIESWVGYSDFII